MGLNETPAANRIHIAFLGKRNAGKSSILNAISNQNLAIVSDTKGTTTDPVYKAMELLPLGPVMLIDTPGIDDEGALGELRIKKTQQVLNKTDIAVLVMDGREGKSAEDETLIQLFQRKEIPYLLVYNKCDLFDYKNPEEYSISVSAKTGEQINALKEIIAKRITTEDPKLRLVGDILKPCDYAMLVVPIDKAAPKGRLILPQQQTIRDILEASAVSIVVKETEFAETIKNIGLKPKIVITDSQVFHKIHAETPEDIFLTSFSILMARYKGVLKTAVNGAKTLDMLKDGDKILISEGCTHHRQCDDIGTVKLPQWIKNYTKKDFEFQFTSGTEFPENLSSYQLVIHCGGCMLNDREMKYRQKFTVESNIPFTNYGILIAYMQGILQRSISMFPEFLAK
ncbi:[FeFe] hydrogenase H-cluster maturation GTPase HydF [Anaerotignum propionicum]|uniref:[FeFe] hydrogenase H-cluster maturation GTPase HydF n=1 Tax=Anaerotignum propionicum TaxID=28446 RepID=UPI00210B5A45|nr:[FeFe] hydrogenase H-cluster maturation GTPase HydF [Anaerotignum propionicum]MCQ4936694.1 [FeFe] hydrogenase H-cluster maturation GTPase HydF [Anaerotignum propionicum]